MHSLRLERISMSITQFRPNRFRRSKKNEPKRSGVTCSWCGPLLGGHHPRRTRHDARIETEPRRMIARRRAILLFIALSGCIAMSCRSRASNESPSESRSDADAGEAGFTAEKQIRRRAGTPCNGTTLKCPSDAYCVFTPGLCGKGKDLGTCMPKAAECSPDTTPVCGCDGHVYPNACDAQAQGIDLDVTGSCHQRIPDKIACGAHFCDARTRYCEIVLSDVFDLPTDCTCKPLPKTCSPDGKGKSAKDCSCFPAGTKCLSFCGPIETGGIDGFHLTCRL